MKTETLLLIAGAVGVGYYLHKKKLAEATTAAVQAAKPTARIAALPEEDADVVFVEPAYPAYYPVPGWGPSWGGWRGGGGHHGHHGGHHGHHGFHGFHGRRR